MFFLDIFFEKFSKFSRVLNEEYLNLKFSSQSLDFSRKNLFDSIKFSGHAMQEAKRNFNHSEEMYCNQTKKTEKPVLCPSLNLATFNYCSPNKNIKDDNEVFYKIFMAKQDIYQRSEKIYNEKVTNLLGLMKNTCQETVEKVQKAYTKIKSLYDKGIVSFYDEEKKMMSEENVDKKQNVFNLKYETPEKNLRKSPSFSNFDSEVRIESTGEKQKQEKIINKNLSDKKEVITCLTFKKEEAKIDDSMKKLDDSMKNSKNSLKNSKKSSEYEMNCRMNDSLGSFEESLGKQYIRNQGLVLKKSHELSIKGKLRYFEEKS